MLLNKMKQNFFLAIVVAISCTASNAATTDKNAQKILDDVLVAYERPRILLADDKTEGLSESADAMKTAAQNAAEKVPPLKTQLDAIASAADTMKASSNLDSARKAFGELSRATIALGAAEPSLQKGRYVFECSMASGYKKWIQTSEQISNPYMGKTILTCGVASDWK
jgi:hypothetical protein